MTATCHADRPNAGRGLCKPCYNAANYAANADRIRAGKRAYRARRRPQIHAYNAARYERLRPSILADNAAWSRAHPDRRRASAARRQARIRANGIFRITERDWRRLVARYDGTCAYCGRGDRRLSPEHLIPVSRGGRHSIGNLVPACAPCNLRKGRRFLVEWRALDGRVRVAA